MSASYGASQLAQQGYRPLATVASGVTIFRHPDTGHEVALNTEDPRRTEADDIRALELQGFELPDLEDSAASSG